MRVLCHISTVLLLCIQFWGLSSRGSLQLVPPTRGPVFSFSEGPGTIISVRTLSLPFVKPRCAVAFKTDQGELIEVWHSGTEVPVIEGMRGTLIYSMHPEEILGFRVITKK